MHILVAEDEKISQRILKSALERWGYMVTVTSDGEEAYSILCQDNAPTVAILDWVMPKINGLELCTLLRKEKGNIPLYLILLTAKDQQKDIVTGLEAGADDFIVKPFNPEELRARLNVGRRIVELQEKVREYHKMEGVLEMAGAVCHEMNQPLQVILSNSEMLQAGKSPEKTKQYVSKIKTCALQVGEITRKVMSVSRYRTKAHMDGRRRIVDLIESKQDTEGQQ